MKSFLFLLGAFLLLGGSAVDLEGEFLNTDPIKFKVVLDAGHGGKKPGNTYAGIKEKDIALKVTLEVGRLLEKHDNIEVLYTRKKDIDVGLKARADVANNANADLFVSIHLNAFDNKNAHGVETYALGLTKSKENLQTVIMENSVILLEDNYEENYGGFDPKDPSSYGTGMLAQEEYLENSLEAASFVQKNMVSATKRRDRGVKQNWYVVLLKSYMPSILIELGFLSNTKERKFLTNPKNQKLQAKSIYKGILQYVDSRDFNSYVPEDATVTAVDDDTIYKVQIAASKNKIAAKSYNFKKLPKISREEEGGLYRYFTGESSSLSDIQKLKKRAERMGYKGAFIVQIKEGKRSRVQ
ncbi:MAG: N-acetylmuramoyl-L-alanine amidase [Nonlabens sp.]